MSFHREMNFSLYYEVATPITASKSDSQNPEKSESGMSRILGEVLTNCRRSCVSFSCQLSLQRSIFISSSTTKKPYRKATKTKEKNSRDDLERFVRLDDEKRFRDEERQFAQRLKEVKSLTANVSRIIQESEKRKKLEKELGQKGKTPEPQKSSKEVYQALSEGNEVLDLSQQSLVVPAYEVPKSISKALGLSVKYLVSKQNLNWPLVLGQLEQAGGFRDIPRKEIREFIDLIPSNTLPSVIPQIEAMLKTAKLPLTSKIVNIFISSLLQTEINEELVKRIENYVAYLRKHNKEGALSKSTYELLITAYGKSSNVDKIETCLQEMKQKNVAISSNLFSNLLATSVYKTRDHSQAVAIFDSMNFLSNLTRPGTRAYQDIIVSYINNDDIEKSLDLYQDMVIKQIPLNQKILVALARGCTSRRELRVKAWDFMFEIYNQGWEPTIETYEYILYLTAKDGDVALARALYNKLHISKSVSSRAFGFLLLAYSKSPILMESGNLTAPLPITVHEKGRIFRKNVLSDNEITPDNGTIENPLPFLPTLDLHSTQEIMAESSAIWAHTLIFNPQFVNGDSCNTFLNIAAEFGTLDEFIDRFDSFTYFDTNGLATNSSEVIVEEDEDDHFADHNEKGTITKSPILDEMPLSSQQKVARSTLAYVVALKVAAKFNNYAFAKKIWSERGQYRKTIRFQSLSRATKDELDFLFANTMVLSMTRMKLLDDALAILLSTEYQFKWTWKELHQLHKAAVEMGNDKVTRTVRGIARRAQINYAGKIRYRDYKRYQMEKGY